MRILFIGDVVGSPGRDMVKENLTKLQRKYHVNFTIINGENAASGKGINEAIYKGFIEQGANVVTLGNHAWDKRDIFEFIDDAKHLVRPANFPSGTPGNGYVIKNVNGVSVGVINLQGRTFLPPIDCPFTKVDEILEVLKKKASIIFVDFHAEATSEKQAMGWYLNGKVSAVVGTHTHVQTSDNRILPDGTAYITDVGMTGPYDGILGVNREPVIKRFLTSLPVRFDVANGRTQLNGVIIDVNEKTGKASSIERIVINDESPFFEWFLYFPDNT